MIYFVGAGSGAPDLITVRGARLLSQADVIVYAGSLVNPALLEYKKDDCAVYNSAKMTLEEVIAVMAPAARAGKTVVRLHTGDPCVYGAHREQMDELDKLGLPYEVCPGVSSFCGAAVKVVDIASEESFSHPEHTLEKLVCAAREAVHQDGADVILLGCGVMTDFAGALSIEHTLGVPVVDPLAAGVKTAETLAFLGLSHSRRGYAFPTGTELHGIDGVLNYVR